MNARIAIPVILAIVLSACSPKSDTAASTGVSQAAGDFNVTTRFLPDPPQKGSETITFTIKDASGNPVKGATVSVATNMPTMSMAGPKLSANDTGDGTYAVQTNLNYATQWTFDIKIAAAGKTGVAHMVVDVR
jgi:nitrogen fixation protein FixH